MTTSFARIVRGQVEPPPTTEPTEVDVIDDVGSALSENSATQWVTAVAIMVAAMVVARMVRLLVARLVNSGRANPLLGDLIGRLVSYVVLAFGLVYSLDHLGVAIGPVLGALGVIGLALAFAMQSILENFVAGVLLQVRRPFTAGDEIESNDYQGRILSIDSRTMSIKTPDGEIVRLPNAEVLANPIVNLTKEGMRRTTVEVGVAYGTDLGAATEVAQSAAQEVEGVLDHPHATAQVFRFGDSSIDMAVRFWHKPTIAEQWRVRHEVALAVSAAFATNEIHIPFPQRTLHLAPGLMTEMLEPRNANGERSE